MLVQKYKPSLKDLVKVDSLPENLGFIQAPLGDFLDKLYYQNLQAYKSPLGNSASYTLDIVTYNELVLLQIPGTGIKFIINPSDNPSIPNASIFNVSFKYSWEILRFINGISLETFSFDLSGFITLISSIFKITPDQLLEETINVFIGDIANPPTGQDPLQDFVNKYNANHVNQLSYTPGVTTFSDIIAELTGFGEDFLVLIVSDYLEDTFDNFKLLISKWIGPLDENRLRDLLIPQLSASLNNISFGIEFPRSVFIPIDPSDDEPYPEPIKTMLKVTAGSFSYDSKLGFAFENNLSFDFPKSQILNSGFTLEVQTLKIDLSDTQNIPEANDDGRPVTFKGVYIKEATIGFPQFWNHDDTSSTGIIKARNLLAGTGGLSGNLSLEAKVSGDPAPLVSAKFGNDFVVTLDSFNIAFQQNSIIGSEIHGTMKIPGFKDSTGAQAIINIDVSIEPDGDFSVTASEDQGIDAISIPDVFDFRIKSLSVGRQDSKFFVAVSGNIDFKPQGNLGQFLPKDIEIKKMIIYDDGKFEFEGGAITFPKAYTLKLGPADISITAIHMGSHEQEHGGSIRKYKYFGFDGGVSINPGGVDARGDGVKFYGTVDGGPYHFFVRIQSLKIDIILPGDTTEEKAAFVLKGWLAMKAPTPPAPPDSTEYAGGVEIKIPKLRGLEGAASMRYNPSVPSFIVDAGIEISKAIPLGSTGLGIYGFRGLFGRRYVATKPAAGVPEDGEWWQYYKAKIASEYKEGIVVDKFEPKNGLSIGAGVSLATTADSGKTFSSKLFFMLSMPDVFLFQGQAALMKERITLTSPDPPFFAIVAITSQSVEAGFGLDFKLKDDGNIGKLVTVQGIIEMGFFWGNSTAWYVNIGRDTPAERRIQARVGDLFNMYFYLMISNNGIRAGAGATFGDKKKFGPLRAELSAYIDLAGRISFKPKQVGGSINLGGSVGLYIFKFGFTLSVHAGLAAESSKPRIFTGTLEVCIKVLKKEYCAKFELTWNYDNSLDFTSVPLIDSNALSETAKTVNQLTKETLNLFTSIGASIPAPASWPGGADKYIVPLDSFIDIEFKKGLKVNGSHVSLSKFGGVTTGSVYTDYIAPQKGKSDRVRHEYIANKIEILYYSSDSGTGGTWKNFDLYEALTPQQDAAFVDQTALANLKLGYWMMEEPGKFNKLRVLAQDPLSYYNGGYNVEDMGVTDETIFCGEEPLPKTCVDFIDRKGTPSIIPADTFFAFKNFMFRIIGHDGHVVNFPYGSYPNALALQDGDKVEIYFDESMACIDIVMQTVADNVTVEYFGKVTTNPTSIHELPTYSYSLIQTSVLTNTQLNVPVHYESDVNTIDKIIITAGPCDPPPPGTALYCTADVTQQALQLEVFFNVLIRNKHFIAPNTFLYPEFDRVYNGVFQNSVLYNKPLKKGNTILYTVTKRGMDFIEMNVKDDTGFSCDMSLALVTPDPIFDVAKVTRFKNIRPDTNNVSGTNFTFLIDAEMPVSGGVQTFVMRGRTCYPVTICFEECSTFIYEFCSLSLEDYLYNQTIPSASSVAADAEEMIDALTKTLQPVWRPNTHYAIRIEVEDKRYQENSFNSSSVDTFVFGFKTAGPVAHYHIFPTAPDDNDKRDDFEQKELADRDAEFQLATLNPYIDYPKCFPNADGQLINAKPLYYKNPKLLVFYNKPYVYQFYNNWDSYPPTLNELEAINSSLEVNIKDPAEEDLVTPSTTTWKNIQPDVSQIQEVFNALPLPDGLVALNNMLENGNPCVSANTPLLPLVPYTEITFPDLKPLKLYTSIMNAKYQRMLTDTQPHVREAHKYPFETSRYGDFEEHINSYILKSHVDTTTGDTIIDKASIYTIAQAFDNATQITVASQFVTNPDSVADNLIQEYGHPFDRIIDGILKIRSDKTTGQSLEPAVTNEFNFIKDTNTGNMLGVLVRSPEPYNDPKLPANILAQTITAQRVDGSLVDPGYKVFFSKDNAKAFITKDDSSLNIPLTGTLIITFSYMLWDGFQYSNVGAPVNVEIDLSTL